MSCALGHIDGYYKGGRCKRCAIIATRKWRDNPKNKANTLANRLAYNRRIRLRNAEHPPPEVCEICLMLPKRHLDWDHDHKTGKFRGWLCNLCNQGLGQFKDSPDVLRKAASYLENRR